MWPVYVALRRLVNHVASAQQTLTLTEFVSWAGFGAIAAMTASADASTNSGSARSSSQVRGAGTGPFQSSNAKASTSAAITKASSRVSPAVMTPGTSGNETP